MWTNYHTHCSFCDGKGEPLLYVQRASELNMHSIGFSSHAPLPFFRPWCMRGEQMNNYLDNIRSLKEDHRHLSIYSSLEVDYIPGLISPTEFEGKLDYTIGSIHFVDRTAEGEHWEIDNTHEVFLHGLNSIFKGNARHAISRYFELTRDMVKNGRPTIVGHLDKIKIQNREQQYFAESDGWYRDAIKTTLEAIKEAGCIVEVNTRGIYQKKSPDTYPSPWVLELMLSMGIPITINSDAHHPDHLVSHFTETASLLKRIGYKDYLVLSNGAWTPLPFDEHGI
jgi:histidinol-phosphatase (PHP family)